MKLLPLTALALTYIAGTALAQPPKPKPKQAPVPAQNQTKGTAQAKGGDGVFGTVYTLQGGLNLAIVSARYSIEPYVAYSGELADEASKFLILTCAIKNSNKEDLFFDASRYTFTAVDEKNQNYTGYNWRQTSAATQGFSPNLKPGQGLGQDPAKDAIEVAIKVPFSAKIGKVILNLGRATVPGEEVVRYFVAGTENGNPKNSIKPLIASYEQHAGGINTFSVSSWGVWVLENMQFVTGNLGEHELPEDKKFFVATVKLAHLFQGDGPIGELLTHNGGGSPFTLVDADGEKFEEYFALKKSSDDNFDEGRVLKPGEEVALRIVVAVPKNVQLKKITYGTPGFHRYSVAPETIK